jgi:hypothetical protein
MPHGKESREVSSSDSSQLPESKDKVQQIEILDDTPRQHSVINDEKSESSEAKEGNQESDDVFLCQVPDTLSDDSIHDGELPGKLCVLTYVVYVV